MTWPDGREGLILFNGHARDIRTTDPNDEPEVLAEDRFRARLGWDRIIREIQCDPPREALDKLAGARGGGHLRGILDELLHEELEGGSPLYLLLDDLSGTSLIAGWAWSRWTDDWMDRGHGGIGDNAPRPVPRRMENICIGFASGSSALSPDGSSRPGQNTSPVVPLPNPEDPHGWHPLVEHTGVSMRRARRIDVWREDVIRIDAGFQDTASAPEGGRVAIHEYSLRATADPETLKLMHVEATPHVLPYAECPTAINNIHRLVNEELAGLRLRVIDQLRGPMGCTHLNDALRSLAESPILAAKLT